MQILWMDSRGLRHRGHRGVIVIWCSGSALSKHDAQVVGGDRVLRIDDFVINKSDSQYTIEHGAGLADYDTVRARQRIAARQAFFAVDLSVHAARCTASNGL